MLRLVAAMRLTEVPPPMVLPAFAAGYAARFSGGGPFEAGRACARQAIGRLAPDSSAQAIPRGAAGEPVWPSGLTGSITHKDDLAWAVVAYASDTRGIGIDVEAVPAADRTARVSGVVLGPDEEQVGQGTLTPAERVALVLSIKESAFKCLYPLVGRRFYYDAMKVTGIDFTAGVFAATILTRLAHTVEPGLVLTGRFTIDVDRVATAIILSPETVRRP